MNLPDDTHLAYIVSHEAWYARTPGVIDGPSVTVAASAKGSGGGVAWEFSVDEHELGGKTVIEAGLFDDSFDAFAQIPEFFAALADRKVTTLAGVRAVLDGMGAVDETERVSPYPDRARPVTPRDRVVAALEGMAANRLRVTKADREEIADIVSAIYESTEE